MVYILGMMIPTRQVAVEAGVTQQTVRKTCRRLRIPMVGRDYLLTPAQVQRVVKHIQNAKPGRPAKGAKE